jgi:hypothetical protein
VEEAVEAVAALDWAAVWSGGWVGRSQPEPAMWTLVMVMLEEVAGIAAGTAAGVSGVPIHAS